MPVFYRDWKLFLMKVNRSWVFQCCPLCHLFTVSHQLKVWSLFFLQKVFSSQYFLHISLSSIFSLSDWMIDYFSYFHKCHFQNHVRQLPMLPLWFVWYLFLFFWTFEVTWLELNFLDELSCFLFWIVPLLRYLTLLSCLSDESGFLKLALLISA